MYTYNLSQFLPDPDHPDYERLEAELPEYQKGLEQRYPQCCARCEPKVRAQLHQATYNARSDHLRRVLDKSRQRRIASRWGWRSLLVSAAGLGYFASLALQVLWHLYGSQIVERSSVPGFRLVVCLERRAFLSQCLDLMEPLVGLSLTLGLLCIWWNPKWQHKLLNNEGRLVGLYEYYSAQFALLCLRFVAWVLMFHAPLSSRMRAMLHACFAVTITGFAVWSVLSIIRIRIVQPINWHEDPAPLLSSGQFVPPVRPAAEEPQRCPVSPFSVPNLASPGRKTYPAWNPPTPPKDIAESMDWTPSQPSFQPELKQVRYKSTEPTPFHGALPAFNARGVQENSSQRQLVSKQALGLPPGFFDKPSKSALPSREQASASEAIVPPKFFGHDRDADTGLENIFGTVFSLQDRSLELSRSVSKTNATSSQTTRRSGDTESPINHEKDSYSTILSGISCFLIVMGVATWICEAAIRPSTSEFGYYVVLSSTSIPLSHIMLILALKGVKGQVTSLLLYTFEASLLAAIAMLREPFGELLRDLWCKLAIAVVVLLLPQEFLELNRASTTFQHQHAYPTPAQLPPPPPLPKISEQQQTPAAIISPTTPGPQHIRRDSNDSITSRTSIVSTSTAPEWRTPMDLNPRSEFREASSRITASRSPTWQGSNPNTRERAPRRNVFGTDGLSLNGYDSESIGLTSGIKRMRVNPSRSNGTQPRSGLGF